jgi:uncharacterized protein
VRSVLVDAGALIALFAIDDRHHRHFDRLVTELSKDGLRLLTTWPCVVEASYLLEAPNRFEMLRWIQMGGVLAYTFEAADLGDMIPWMEKYTKRGGREMDLADASLCWLAAATGNMEIMTTDLADFSRYRLPDGSAFTLP